MRMGEISRRGFLFAAASLLALQAMPKAISEGDHDLHVDSPDPSRHIFVIGDLHLGYLDPYETTSRFLKELDKLSNGKKGFHIVFNGDFLFLPPMVESSKDTASQLGHFSNLYKELLERGFIPHLVFGNHDGSDEIARTLLLGTASFENVGTNAFSLENGARIVLLSGLQSGSLDLDFFKGELSFGCSEGLFVFSHFPPDSVHTPYINPLKIPDYGILHGNPELLRLIASSGATLVSSHLHSPFYGTYESIHLPKPLNFISTTSFSYSLPIFEKTNPVETRFDRKGKPILKSMWDWKRAHGITVLDTYGKRGRPFFFDGGKRFHPPSEKVQAYSGKYVPHPPARNTLFAF